MSTRFSKTFTAAPEHIDELGHVNNAVWVQWVQDLATAHWQDTARAEDRDTYIWVVIRHELDYRGNIAVGEQAEGETFIPGAPSGAKFDRRIVVGRYVDPERRIIEVNAGNFSVLHLLEERCIRDLLGGVSAAAADRDDEQRNEDRTDDENGPTGHASFTF